MQKGLHDELCGGVHLSQVYFDRHIGKQAHRPPPYTHSCRSHSSPLTSASVAGSENQMAAAPPRPPLDFAKEELFDLMQRFLEYLAEMSERMPFVVNRQKIRSMATLAALSVAIYITWKILRASPTQQRRQNRRLSQVTTVSGARISSNSVVSQSPYHSSPAHLRPQGTVDKLFQSGKLTLEKIVRHRLNEGRKVTCQLLGVILEETTPEDLQEHATFRSSVRDVLVEIAKFCDVYLMERILDDASAVGPSNSEF